MSALLWLLAASVFLTWPLFVFYAALKAVWSRLHWTLKVWAVPFIILGFALDIVLNYGVGFALVFQAWPGRRFTFSKQCGYLRANGNERQARRARIICRDMLDPFVLGGHCKP